MWENTVIIPSHPFIFKTKKSHDLHSITQRPEQSKAPFSRKTALSVLVPALFPPPTIFHSLRQLSKAHDIPLFFCKHWKWSNVWNKNTHCYPIIILKPLGQYFSCICCQKSDKQFKLWLLSSSAPPGCSLLPFYQLPRRKLTSAQPRPAQCGFLPQK